MTGTDPQGPADSEDRSEAVLSTWRSAASGFAPGDPLGIEVCVSSGPDGLTGFWSQMWGRQNQVWLKNLARPGPADS